MRRVATAVLAAAIAVPAGCAQVPAAPSASQRLNALADEALEREMDINPLIESFRIGRGPRAGKLGAAFTDRVRTESVALWSDVKRRLHEVPHSQLAGTDRVTWKMLERQADIAIAQAEFPMRRMTLVAQQGGIASTIVGLATAWQPLETEADFENWLARVDALPPALESALSELRADLGAGMTAPRALVEKALVQMKALTGPVESTSLWAPVKRYPASAGPQARDDWVRRYRASMARLQPVLRRLEAFTREEYLPKARTTSGIGALPGGEAAYRVMVRVNTTTDLPPDEIHELGVREVARIQPRLLAAARSIGFGGSMKELSGWLGSDPANLPFKAPGEVIERLKGMHARIAPQLPKLFKRVPKAAFDIRLVDPVLAPTSSAHYRSPSADGSSPGIFFMPVVDARRTRFSGLGSLLLHEGVPGHHFDNGLKREMDLPRFRKYRNIPAFGEGWGLYAESLGHELGMYDDPRLLVGRYTAEVFRAARLVVDTGIHARGWSRERAIDYLVAETGASVAGATSEVERYMANPGQALAYKIGELTILDLRARAQAALGPRFDIRDFHEVVLQESHIPLAMLRERVAAWLAAR